jgi:selenocysteine lyase/cysteine desulfurase
MIDDIEAREDGGTPGFLQAIRTALVIELKNQMGTENIKKREEELVRQTFDKLSKVKGLNILADNVQNRLGVFSFYIIGIHYNLVVKILNDRFGIQVRGGCACAGTYGHYLLDVSYEHSKEITDKISSGDLSEKPGWVRLSLHPTMTNSELDQFADALHQIVEHIDIWKQDYIYDKHTNEFRHKDEPEDKTVIVKDWFNLD